ncbi:MAG: acetate/propionate family kinase [Planctomycetes bacterium]|nr:acetate/propionate family kinase [Planctomycetota bacterium]
MHALCLNSGSSSLKFAVYRCDQDGEFELARGAVEGISQEHGRIWMQRATESQRQVTEHAFGSHQAAFAAAIDSLSSREMPAFGVVGHRVVHGGDQFDGPTRITPPVLDSLRSIQHFAPLHLPPQIAMIELAQQRFSALPHVACFDTAFFRQMPERAQRYALPRFLWDAGVRRYGFHGLSYESILASHAAARVGRTIIAHLGNGCSMTAVRDGRPMNTTMGFTPAGGLMMGTRTGDLDPGVLIYLLDHNGYGPRDIERVVNRESGLKGVSELSGDMQTLLSVRDANPYASLAITMFCDRIRQQIGAFAAVLDGLDRLIFTAGIGERAVEVRRDICLGLRHLGIELDEAANATNAPRICSARSPCAVEVVCTDEERMIARHCVLSNRTS